MKQNPNLKFPKLPTYLGKIFKFRSAIPAHVDKDEKLTSGDEWIKIYQEVFFNITIKNIINDFEDYFKKLNEQFGDEYL